MPAALLESARTDPETALCQLQSAQWDDEVLWKALRAEVHLRLGRRGDAFNDAMSAQVLVVHESPPDVARHLTAHAILADAAVSKGNPASPQACLHYRELAQYLGEPARVLLAEALYAVAVHHHTDCAHGRDLLADLRERHRLRHGDGGPVDRMLALGLTAMADHHRHPPMTPPRDGVPLTPMAGGLVHPDPEDPHESCLADRAVAQLCHDQRVAAAAAGRTEQPVPRTAEGPDRR